MFVCAEYGIGEYFVGDVDIVCVDCLCDCVFYFLCEVVPVCLVVVCVRVSVLSESEVAFCFDGDEDW